MSQITRTWAAFFAFGVALSHLSLAVGSPLPAAALLLLLGAAEATWGVLVLLKDLLLVPRLALVFALAPLIIWSVLVVAAALGATIPLSLGFVPMGVAALFELTIAAILSLQLRRVTAGTGKKYRAPSTGRYLVSLFAGALVVAMLTTPALASAQAGGGSLTGFNLPAHSGH